MRSFIALTSGLLAASFANAATPSVDGSCGGANGYTCLNSAFGSCCSQYGWCGSSTGHCGTGCNSAFGSCTNSPPPTSSIRSSTTIRTTTSAAQPTSTKKVSTDGSCGGTKGFTCTGSSFGQCCSANGWCGGSIDYCGIGCNSAFGTCPGTGSSSLAPPPSSTSKSTPSASAKPISNDGTCAGTKGSTCLGSSFGNCCSSAGWCGSSSAHCGTGCNSTFGNCGSNTPSSTAAQPSSTPSSLSAQQCLNGKNVPYKMTSDAGYADLISPYNLRLPHTPAVVVLPMTNQHVQDAVVCAGQAGMKVQAKSGGHSYANFASGGKDGSMMISLASFSSVTVDGTGIAKVGGGVRLGNMADAIWNQGKKALSHGTCPGVGIGGHATHGGYGHTSRNWGLAMDAIVKADVVLADGRLVTASSSQNPEIFWGIRGAADSLGIVTNFYMQTRAAPDSITYFEVQFDGIFNTKISFTNAMLHLQDFARNASVVDNRISFGIYMDPYGSFSPSGAFYGSVDEFNAKIRPEFIRNMPTPRNVVVQSYSWYDYLVKVSGTTTIKTPLTGYAEHDNFFAKSITVPETDGLTSASLGSFYEYMKGNTFTDYYTIINLYGGPGSAINSKTTDFAAYNDRDSLWVIQNYGMGANSVDFVNGLNNAVTSAQPQTEFGAYLNYVDPSLSVETAHKVYYGEEVYARLVALKRQIDPKSVFWNPQAVGA